MINLNTVILSHERECHLFGEDVILEIGKTYNSGGYNFKVIDIKKQPPTIVITIVDEETGEEYVSTKDSLMSVIFNKFKCTSDFFSWKIPDQYVSVAAPSQDIAVIPLSGPVGITFALRYLYEQC